MEAPAHEQRDSILKVAVASFIGTAIEWYDFFLYGTAAALVFNRLFFPSFDPLTGTMAAFGTFAVGFIARPLGGVVFGHYGDKLGRKAMLSATLMLMGVATFAVGLLPTYDTVGAWAPALLVLLRLIQGFGLGGEWGGAVLMAVEHAPAHRRGFYGSWPQMGAPAGLLVATAVFSYFSRMPDAAFLAWGWRVPFLLSAVLIGMGVFIRLKVAESPIFKARPKQEAAESLPVMNALRQYPRQILLAMGARFAENGFFYIITTFVLSYGTERLGLPRTTLLNGVLIATSVHLVAIPAFGAASDRFGRRPVYLAGALGCGLMAFPFFWLLDTKETGLIWLAITLGIIAHAAMYGPQASFFSELFGTRVRYSAASLGYQMASVFAGGLSPVIATALLARSGGQAWPVSLYMVALAVVTLVSVWLSAETYRAQLTETPPTGDSLSEPSSRSPSPARTP
ncbi:MHS family MFS transporter [Myxococcus llanfairpwllgwyngyllgogerychwyrndrobwllllantysiliogogogochensis]|uniref:MHS family MFS transporter n=1 Tax=Myxococcus llanfairpwllgwyngyllgogerychwyrndrobwllllantysiliogogogochensis TaxID=2590453 RepID=A0A540WRL4_9BACT|nr:MFS transporter [Myxococcus llanfairpwllgwyngyllgogerychwyrndrobwllllantysiliogogogochensis]TQF11652.1 MHS family MFS transporter [Myxococcus llanfairpwllgwyngyllgogerychwyrndrobwllllantysiliogogogochensis]